MLRRSGLSVTPRFRWECLTIRTVSWFPAPATSHVASRFPALRAPAQFPARVMRPIGPKPLPRSTAHRNPDTPRRVRASRTAIPRPTPSSRILDAGTLGPDGVGSSFLPAQDRMYEKHRLEWPMAKYFTHPRRIGLIFL